MSWNGLKHARCIDAKGRGSSSHLWQTVSKDADSVCQSFADSRLHEDPMPQTFSSSHDPS